MTNQFLQFDKGKPFYDMVMAFMSGLSSCPAIFNAGNPMGYTKDQYITLSGVHVPTKHWFPIEVYEQAQAGHTTQAFFIGTTCLMLMNLAYESVKDHNDHSPEFEFFRHVRNASSHRNNFNFNPREPSRPAAWRGVVIDHTIRGQHNPLHGKQCIGPLLGPADILELLADIERRIAT